MKTYITSKPLWRYCRWEQIFIVRDDISGLSFVFEVFSSNPLNKSQRDAKASDLYKKTDRIAAVVGDLESIEIKILKEKGYVSPDCCAKSIFDLPNVNITPIKGDK
jgi:hypothetical protein